MTKIDGITPGVTPEETSQTKRQNEGAADSFAKLLDQAVRRGDEALTTGTDASPETGPMFGITGAKQPVVGDVLPPLHSEGVMRAERTLDLLENYEQMLGDSDKSLKEVSRAVAALDGEARELVGVLDRLDTNDALFPILQEVAVTAMVESIKFNRGDFNPT
jgi:hypothetical protein